MTKIEVCVDPGGSQTKVIYRVKSSERPRSLLFEPELEEISSENLTRFLERESVMSNPPAVRQAYLEVNKRTYVVGYFASKFNPEDRLDEVKYENALYKTLAAVGVIAEENNLNPLKISLHLAVLLPWNEYQDRSKFHQKLPTYLKEFKFRGVSYSVELEKFICRPEGGGLAAIYTGINGSQWQKSKKLGILMFGHRNITALNFDRGDLTGDSPLIGFSKLLDNVIERTSGLNRERIAVAIFHSLDEKKSPTYSSPSDAKQTFYPVWSDFGAIATLANARDEDLRQQEIEEVSEAIDFATQEYWAIVSKWLAKVFPPDLDSVIISGGASRFLKPDLERHFNCQHMYAKKDDSFASPYIRTGEYQPLAQDRHLVPIIWGAGLGQEMKEILAFGGSPELENSLSYRLVDAYGLFELLVTKSRKRNSKKSHQQISC